MASLVPTGILSLATLGHGRAQAGHRSLARADKTARGIEEAGDSELFGKFFLLSSERGPETEPRLAGSGIGHAIATALFPGPFTWRIGQCNMALSSRHPLRPSMHVLSAF